MQPCDLSASASKGTRQGPRNHLSSQVVHLGVLQPNTIEEVLKLDQTVHLKPPIRLSGPNVLAHRLEDTLAETRAAVEAVNRERKVVQLQAKSEMADYESRWAETVAKNRKIDAACRELEAEIASLRTQLPVQYVLLALTLISSLVEDLNQERMQTCKADRAPELG
jgi:hypothetical protein